MTERRFDTGYWNDPDIMKLPMKAKLLYAYLWTNRHCNQAALYEIAVETISFETGLPVDDIPHIIDILEKKIVWIPDRSLVWVKNFLRHQSKSPKFLAAALDNIKSMNNAIPEDLKDEFYSYNEQLLASANIEHEPSLSKRECVVIRDDFHCQYCGKPLIESSDYEMDHIIPRVRGGKEHYLNLAASCRACNALKLNQTPEEAGLPHPNVTSFHAAQAIFLLKNDISIREKWLKIFPDKAGNIESMLHNVDSTYPLNSYSYSNSLSVSGKEKGVVKGEEETKKTGKREASEIFEHWNNQGIIAHKKLTDDVRSVIVRTLRNYSAEEIKSAISNYAEIIRGQQYFFKYKWTLKDFLKRGIEKFMDLEVAKSNFRKEEKVAQRLSSEEEIARSIREVGQ